MFSKTSPFRLSVLAATGLYALIVNSPASAQVTCDLNGLSGGVNATPADGGATAIGAESLACGPSSAALGDEAIAIGSNAIYNSTSIAGMAIGANTIVNEPGGGLSFISPPLGDLGSIAVGGYAGANGDNNLAIGAAATVGIGGLGGIEVDGGTAVGTRATVRGDGGTALGFEASSTGTGALAIGQGTIADFDNSIILGTAASNVGAAEAIAIGNNADALGIAAIAIGLSVTAGPVDPADPTPLGQGEIAIGLSSSALGRHSISIGGFNTVQGRSSVALGESHDATGTGAVAIGYNNNASGNGAVALGNASSATGEGAVAIGDAATAGADGVAIGNGASTAAFTNSVALGAGSVNTANNQVQVGGRTVSGVAAGTAATDAVNVSQLTAATAGISTDISALEAAQDLMASDIDNLFDLRSHDRRDMKQGVASAMAMAAAPMPSEPGRVAYAVNGATFRGEYAVGGSLTYRLPSDTPMAVNVGFSYAGNKNNGVRVGVAGEF